jgi:hypothetical protein
MAVYAELQISEVQHLNSHVMANARPVHAEVDADPTKPVVAEVMET